MCGATERAKRDHEKLTSQSKECCDLAFTKPVNKLTLSHKGHISAHFKTEEPIIKKLAFITLAMLFTSTTKPTANINLDIVKHVGPEQKLILSSIASCLAARQLNDTRTKSTILIDVAISASCARAAFVFWTFTPHRNGAPATTMQIVRKACAITCLLVGQNGSNFPRELSSFAKNLKEGHTNTSWKERIETALRYAIPASLLINL